MPGPGPGWNVTFQHGKRCITCERMSGTKTFYCYPTMRSYSIRSQFTFQCSQSWCIYFAQCSEHPGSSYVGQTFAEKTATSRGGLYKRHAGHRRDCASGTGGLGAHYKLCHGGSTNTMRITIIDSVAPGNHKLLDHKEEFWIYQLRTMDTQGFGGLNRREEMERRGDRALCDCSCCKRGRRNPGG